MSTSWEAAITALAQLHSLDFKDIGLEDYGSKADYYPRQAKSLSRVSKAQALVKNRSNAQPVGDIRDLDRLAQWLTINCPRGKTTVVHGDYKLDSKPSRAEPTSF